MAHLMTQQIKVELSGESVTLLSRLGDPAEVLARLADVAQTGVFWPQSWQRRWLTQALGEDASEVLVARSQRRAR